MHQFDAAAASYKMAKQKDAEAFALYEGMAQASKLLGGNYLARKDYSCSRLYTEQAIEYYGKVNDAHGLANSHFNLGQLLNRL